MKNFFKCEILNSVKCENCTSHRFVKKQTISKFPECLCIHIQRNSWSDTDSEMVKKSNFVQFPLLINIDEYNKFLGIFTIYIHTVIENFDLTQVKKYKT